MSGTVPASTADQVIEPVPLAGRIITAALVAGPLVAFACLVPFIGGHLLNVTDIVMAVALYVVTGFGISIGFHRLLTHRSFKAKRALKITLAVAGSMALEGSAIGWVAVHRRHHMFGDQPGDPHSPYRYGTGAFATLKGFLWAHVGWLFSSDPTDTGRFAPDLRRDRDIVVIDRLFPVLAVGSLVLPVLHRVGIVGNPVRCAQRPAVGGPRQDGGPSSRHVERQFGLSPVGTNAVRNSRPEHQREGAVPRLVRRELAQLPPRRALLGPPWRPAPPARPVGPIDLALRKTWMGDECAVARPRSDHRPSEAGTDRGIDGEPSGRSLGNPACRGSGSVAS